MNNNNFKETGYLNAIADFIVVKNDMPVPMRGSLIAIRDNYCLGRKGNKTKLQGYFQVVGENNSLIFCERLKSEVKSTESFSKSDFKVGLCTYENVTLENVPDRYWFEKAFSPKYSEN